MKYAVFNPAEGKYSFAESKEEATLLFDTLVSQVADKQFVPQNIQDIRIFIDGWFEDFYAAYAFMCGKTNKTAQSAGAIADVNGLSIEQTHGVYNLTANKLWARVFRYNDSDGSFWLVKVKDNVVTDWYKKSATVNGTQYSWVTFNLDTGEPLETYTTDSNGVLHKTVLSNPDTPVVSTTFAKYDALPQEYKALIPAWMDKSSIFAWSEKSYGKIIEHVENVYKDKSEWSEDVRNKITAATQEAAKKLVSTIEIHTDADGNETWVPVDLGV
jgi:hypothetical protein